MKLGIIGLGKMGEAIAQGLSRGAQKPHSIQATTRSPESAKAASKNLGLVCHTDNAKLVAESEVILLCVKPHQTQKLLESLASKLEAKHLLISICAAITTDQLKEWSGGKAAIIRAMRMTWERMKIVIEPSGAVPLACLVERAFDVAGARVGIIISGGNVDLDHLPWQTVK